MTRLEVIVGILGPMLVRVPLTDDDLKDYISRATKAADYLIKSLSPPPIPHTCGISTTNCFHCGKLIDNGG